MAIPGANRWCAFPSFALYMRIPFVPGWLWGLGVARRPVTSGLCASRVLTSLGQHEATKTYAESTAVGVLLRCIPRHSFQKAGTSPRDITIRATSAING